MSQSNLMSLRPHAAKRGEGPDPVDIAVGKRLRFIRGAFGLAQMEVAASLGVTFQQIQKYENGRNRISASRLYDLARLFNVEVSYFYQDLPSPCADAGIKQSGNRFGVVLQEMDLDRNALQIMRLLPDIKDPSVLKAVRHLLKVLAKNVD